MSAMNRMLRQCLGIALCVLVALTAISPAAQAARETTYYHTDGLGSVVAASNQAGELLWRKEYAPFGDQIDQTTDTEKLGYTGKPHDELLGLTNLGARYYDPHLGRFMSPDPVGFVESNPMSFNRYAYVNNNPYKYVDPDGEFLNFAAKFVLDVGVNIAINYVTTGEMNVGGALKDSAVGILNPAKTVANMGRLGMALSKGAKKLDNLDPCPLSCFVAGTTVLAERGYVPIETLKEGDLVWAHDPDTGETALKPIVRTFVNTKDSVWRLEIEKEGVRYLHEVTGSHPYYVVGQGWTEVAYLQTGATLLTEGDKTATIASLRDTGGVLTTYNFEVADIHTYFVSAAKVLVHNCGGKVAKYEVGAFDDLHKRSTPGDGLQIHHAAQKHPAGQVISGYDPNTGPSIALPDAEHQAIRNLRGSYSGSARDLLARDLRNLRNSTGAPNSAIQDLAKLNKKMYPDAFKK